MYLAIVECDDNTTCNLDRSTCENYAGSFECKCLDGWPLTTPGSNTCEGIRVYQKMKKPIMLNDNFFI